MKTNEEAAAVPYETPWKYGETGVKQFYIPTPGWHKLKIMSAYMSTYNVECGETDVLVINWVDRSGHTIDESIEPRFQTRSYMTAPEINMLIKLSRIATGDENGRMIIHPASMHGIEVNGCIMITEKHNSMLGGKMHVHVIDVEPVKNDATCPKCGKPMKKISNGVIQMKDGSLEECDVVMECPECGIRAYGYSRYEKERTVIEDWEMKE